jgi:hypothetical protein
MQAGFIGVRAHCIPMRADFIGVRAHCIPMQADCIGVQARCTGRKGNQLWNRVIVSRMTSYSAAVVFGSRQPTAASLGRLWLRQRKDHVNGIRSGW